MKSPLMIVLLVFFLVLIVFIAVILQSFTQHVQRQPPQTKGLFDHGMWSRWSRWSSCTASCGGGLQTRTRDCYSPLDSRLPCVGEGSQTRQCAIWLCPDCSRKCPEGSVLSSDCTICQCPNCAIDGRVAAYVTFLESSNRIEMPVSGAQIYSRRRMWSPLTTTNIDGEFEVKTFALSDLDMVIMADGYIERNVTLNEQTHAVNETLIRIERPRFVRQPEDLFVALGDNVTYTCNVEAVPEVEGYDWFFNDVIIPDGHSRELVIDNVNQSCSGEYKCRVTQLGRQRFSRTAKLFVRDPAVSDTCYDVPKEDFIHLEDNCITENGSKVIDVGSCSGDVCSCSHDPQADCCGSKETREIHVQCLNYNYSIPQTIKCGCLPSYECDKSARRIEGKIRPGLNNGTIIPQVHLGHLVVEGDIKTMNLSVVATFIFYTTRFASNIVLHYIPNYNLTDSVTVLPEVKAISAFDEVIIFTLHEASSIVTIKINETNEITDTGDDLLTFITIPANSIRTREGGVSDGVANIVMKVYNPNRNDDILHAPGRFESEDEDGSLVKLETFGVFGIVAVDPVNGKLLHIHGEIEIGFNSDEFGLKNLNDLSKISLWNMDPHTGRWLEVVPLQVAERGDKTKKKKVPTATLR